MLGGIFDRFINGSAITVMAGAAISRLLSPERLNTLFEKNRREQYTYKLTFSTVFSLMAAAVTGTRKSINDAYLGAKEEVGATVRAVYDKLSHIETTTSQAMVRSMAAEVAPLIDEMGGGLPAPAPGYEVRILDGNCLAACHHRIKEVRDTAAGVLPGKSLVVLDPQRRLITDVFPCEDGHAQERALLHEVVPTIKANQLWIADRNFCTFDFLHSIVGAGAFFIIRQHGNMVCHEEGPWETHCESETGTVMEQRVVVRGTHGRELHLRRIAVHLKQKTRDGDMVIYLLTNLPREGSGAVDAGKIADLYGTRWTIETAFQELTEHLNSEISALGYPRAALFGFCVALVIFNAIALMKAALRAAHGAEKVEAEVSNYYIAAEIETTWQGMMIAIPVEDWRIFATMEQKMFAEVMVMMAAQVKLPRFKKHPRGPKKPKPKPEHDTKRPHISIAKFLELRGFIAGLTI